MDSAFGDDWKRAATARQVANRLIATGRVNAGLSCLARAEGIAMRNLGSGGDPELWGNEALASIMSTAYTLSASSAPDAQVEAIFSRAQHVCRRFPQRPCSIIEDFTDRTPLAERLAKVLDVVGDRSVLAVLEETPTAI